ncbi:MAG: DUF5652 family protein [Bacillota bacterium]
MVYTVKIPELDPWVIAAAVAWSIFWKGLALWRAARNDQRGWFIALLLINTLGLLEMLYLGIWGKKRTAWGRRRW